jgi:hypothetical protein
VSTIRSGDARVYLLNGRSHPENIEVEILAVSDGFLHPWTHGASATCPRCAALAQVYAEADEQPASASRRAVRTLATMPCNTDIGTLVSFDGRTDDLG